MANAKKQPKARWTWRGKPFTGKDQLIAFLREKAREAVSGWVQEDLRVAKEYHVTCNPRISIVPGAARKSKKSSAAKVPRSPSSPKKLEEIPALKDSEIKKLARKAGLG